MEPDGPAPYYTVLVAPAATGGDYKAWISKRIRMWNKIKAAASNGTPTRS